MAGDQQTRWASLHSLRFNQVCGCICIRHALLGTYITIIVMLNKLQFFFSTHTVHVDDILQSGFRFTYIYLCLVNSFMHGIPSKSFPFGLLGFAARAV